MIRRESGMSSAIDRNEHPITQFPISIQALLGAGIVEEGEDGKMRLSGLGVKTMKGIQRATQGQAQTLRQHDTMMIIDGMETGEILSWDQNLDGSDQFLQRLDFRWTQATGFAPIESADSGAVESGVALARRNAMGVARTRSQIWAPLKSALTQVLGRPAEWEFVDAGAADDGMGDDGMGDDPMFGADPGMAEMGRGGL